MAVRARVLDHRGRRRGRSRGRHLLLTSYRKHRQRKRQTDDRELPFTEHEHRLLNSSTCPTPASRSGPRGQLLQLGSVGQHGINLAGIAASLREDDVDAIGRPTGILVLAIAVRQLHVVPSSNIHSEYVEGAGGITLGPRKSDVLPVGMPRRIGRFANYPVSIALRRLHPYSSGKSVADRSDPKRNTISAPVFGFTFGSTSMALDEEIGRNPVPSKFAIKIRQHLPVPADEA